MNIKGFISSNLKQTERFISKNSPAILTGIGAVGVVATAYLTHKAAISSRDHVPFVRTEDGGRKEIDLSTRERFELTWKLYIPPVITGAVSIGAILCANRVSTRRTAAMAAAVTLSERAYDEYRDKVKETLGEKKEHKLRDELAQEQLLKHPPANMQAPPMGKMLCRDSFSMRYFYCDVETLRRAENDVNKYILRNDAATLTYFYGKIGLQPTDVSDEIGWNTDKMLELEITSVITPDNVPGVPASIPALSFSFASLPMPDPHKYY